MTDSFQLSIEDSPKEEEAKAVHQGLHEHDHARAGEEGWERLAVLFRDGEGRIVGGLLGATFWRWLHVEAFWVREDLRGRGYGTRLIRAAEEEATRRGCVGVYLETTSFQARPFYEKMGYEVFGELTDFPPGESFYFLRKRLQPGSNGDTA